MTTEFPEEIQDQFVAGVASIKEQQTPRRDEWKKVLHFIAFRRICRDHGSCDRKLPKDIVRGGDEALGIVPFSRGLEPTVGIKLVSNLGCGRKVEFRAVYPVHRHSVPRKPRIFRPAFIGQFYCVVEYVSKGMPVDLLARFGERTMVNGFGVRPEAASLGSTKEFTGFHVHSFSLSTGDHGEEEDDKLVKRQFSVSGKMLGSQLPGGFDLSRNNSQNFVQKKVKLA
jgi:hypothetical protein